MGSFTAVRNRTMDRAPTMPRDTTTLERMVRMMAVVTTAIATREMLKLLE